MRAKVELVKKRDAIIVDRLNYLRKSVERVLMQLILIFMSRNIITLSMISVCAVQSHGKHKKRMLEEIVCWSFLYRHNQIIMRPFQFLVKVGETGHNMTLSKTSPSTQRHRIRS